MDGKEAARRALDQVLGADPVDPEIVEDVRRRLLARYPRADVDRAIEWARKSASGVADWLELPDLYPYVLPVFLRKAEAFTSDLPRARQQWLDARKRMKEGYNRLPFGPARKKAYRDSLDEVDAERLKGE